MSTSYLDVPLGIRLIQRYGRNENQQNRLFRYELFLLFFVVFFFTFFGNDHLFAFIYSISIRQFNNITKCMLYQFCLLFHRYKFSVLALTYVAYTCYHLTRKPISVVKAVLHRNCSLLEVPKQVTDATNESTWCDYAPFGKLNLA